MLRANVRAPDDEAWGELGCEKKERGGKRLFRFVVVQSEYLHDTRKIEVHNEAQRDDTAFLSTFEFAGCIDWITKRGISPYAIL